MVSLNCLGSAHEPHDKSDDKNSSENAATEVHENLLRQMFDSNSSMVAVNCPGATEQSMASFSPSLYLTKLSADRATGRQRDAE